MLISLLPLVSLVSSNLLAGGGAADELGVTTPRGAQVRLAELLAEADAIDGVEARGRTVVFTVERAGVWRQLIATVDARGHVIALALEHASELRGNVLAPAIAHAGAQRDAVATVDARGRVPALAVEPVATEPHDLAFAKPHDQFGWLASELDDALAITTLEVGRDGAVTALTDDDRRYRLIAGRGGNTAVEARWAAAWDAR